MPAPSLPRQPGTGSAWFDEPVALRLMCEEQRQATPLLTQYIGVRGLYLRPGVGAPAELSGNMLQTVTRLHALHDRLVGDVGCSFEALPFDSETFCLVYGLHVIEDAIAPQQRIAELARVLRPEGVAFLVCLSAASLWRLRWNRRGIDPPSAAKLRGWLAASGLLLERELGVGPVLPWIGEGQHRGGSPAAWRAARLFVARKRKPALTPVAPRQRRLPVGAHAPV